MDGGYPGGGGHSARGGALVTEVGDHSTEGGALVKGILDAQVGGHHEWGARESVDSGYPGGGSH